jgi:hypothetical protein
MTPPILNIDALDFQPWGHGVSIPGAGQANDRYQARIGFAGGQLGANKLAGDIIACPPGGPETAHHIVNTSEAYLKVLAVSTRLSPEVCEYPDTGRFGLLAEMPGAADGKPRELRFMGRAGESLEYWKGE